MVQDFVLSLGSVVFLLVGLVTANRGRKERAASTRMEAIETAEVRDIEPGPVEIIGTAYGTEAATPQTSPLEGTDAVAVHVEVKEWRTDGHGGGNWKTIYEDERAEPMYVDDGTGEVLVDLPADGGLNLEQSEWTVEAGDDPPPEVRTFVEREPELDLPEGHDFGPVSTGERRRYLEGTLEPGEDAYVLGTARETDAGWDARTYEIDAPTADGDFVLSDKSEARLIAEGKRGGLVFLVAGGLMTLIGLGGLVAPLLSV